MGSKLILWPFYAVESCVVVANQLANSQLSTYHEFIYRDVDTAVVKQMLLWSIQNSVLLHRVALPGYFYIKRVKTGGESLARSAT